MPPKAKQGAANLALAKASVGASAKAKAPAAGKGKAVAKAARQSTPEELAKQMQAEEEAPMKAEAKVEDARTKEEEAKMVVTPTKINDSDMCLDNLCAVQNELKQRNREIAVIRDRSHRAEMEIKELRARNNELMTMNTKLTGDLAKLREHNSCGEGNTTMMQSSSEPCSEADTELVHAKAQIGSLQKRCKELEQVDTDLMNAKAQVEALQKRCNELEGADTGLVNARAQIEELQKRCKEAEGVDTDLVKAKSQIEALQKRCKELEEADADLANAKAQIDELQKRYKELEDAKAHAEEAMEHSNDALQKRCKDLECLLEAQYITEHEAHAGCNEGHMIQQKPPKIGKLNGWCFSGRFPSGSPGTTGSRSPPLNSPHPNRCDEFSIATARGADSSGWEQYNIGSARASPSVVPMEKEPRSASSSAGASPELFEKAPQTQRTDSFSSFSAVLSASQTPRRHSSSFSEDMTYYSSPSLAPSTSSTLGKLFHTPRGTLSQMPEESQDVRESSDLSHKEKDQVAVCSSRYGSPSKFPGYIKPHVVVSKPARTAAYANAFRALAGHRKG
eukprot:gnl/MRDRNA2_/MRDRNA2_101414_c0_seq1.p1 gnl/MRDRNA2_/MRDRNA2_101414_c0~~gnl/MRDRNA2_/MRDRNA2_101414_c0_seq1.p1  ORF type:complete len:563 (+),score=158.94 gnl/MRDRNA2_/MRDRNA2_101414_c0_seq1:111-1799(+)